MSTCHVTKQQSIAGRPCVHVHVHVQAGNHCQNVPGPLQTPSGWHAYGHIVDGPTHRGSVCLAVLLTHLTLISCSFAPRPIYAGNAMATVKYPGPGVRMVTVSV